jgi:hypothetical protein
VTPKLRIRLAVAVAAVVGAGAVTGVVLATRQTPPQPKLACAHVQPRFVPGVGTAASVAAVRAAFATWPRGTVDRLEELAVRWPDDPVVRFNFGLALDCRGYFADAQQALTAAKRLGRNTQYEIDADQLLHPTFFQGGYPIFQPTGGEPLLVQGSLLQREGHQHSAERLYARAARLRPQDVEAQVAAAVGRFDEDNPSAAFSRLGPLTRRFRHSQLVRYYLGLLLVWIGEGKQGITQFRKAEALGPSTPLGKQVRELLARIEQGGPNGTTR